MSPPKHVIKKCEAFRTVACFVLQTLAARPFVLALRMWKQVGHCFFKGWELKSNRYHHTHNKPIFFSPVACAVGEVSELGFCEKCTAEQVSIREIVIQATDQIKSSL